MNKRIVSLALIVMLVTFAASFSLSILVATPALAQCQYSSYEICVNNCGGLCCCCMCIGSGNCWQCKEFGPPCC